MFLTQLKLVAGVALVVVALGAGSVAYRTADAQPVPPPSRAAGKPQNELEALRRENELLKLNLEVVLEKVRAQEGELRTLRAAKAQATYAERVRALLDLGNDGQADVFPGRGLKRPDAAQQAEAALKALREAKDNAARQRAVDALDRALRHLREQLRQPGDTAPRPDPVPAVKKS